MNPSVRLRVWVVLYNLFVFTTLFLFLLPLVVYVLLVKKVRAGFFQKMGLYPKDIKDKLTNKPDGKKRVWFHAVSVGEFNAIKPLMQAVSDEGVDVVLTTTTLTSQTLAKTIYPDWPVLYYPYDVLSAVQAAHQLIQPDLVVVAETEIWPNFIAATADTFNVPLIFINGRISQRSFKGYQKFKWFFKPFLQMVSHFYMQSSADATRMKSLSDLPDEQVTVAGNLKFDVNPVIDIDAKNKLASLLNITPLDSVLTFASTHSGEDEIFIRVFQQLKSTFPELKGVLVPRHPERRAEITNILNRYGQSFSLRSKLGEEKRNKEDFMVLDTIGELMSVYSFSTLAVMGGSFIDRGGQNPLEPLSFGVPVIFGPSMDNFKIIAEAVTSAQCGVRVEDEFTLSQAVSQYLTTPEEYKMASSNARELLVQNQGAKSLLLSEIKKIVGV